MAHDEAASRSAAVAARVTDQQTLAQLESILSLIADNMDRLHRLAAPRMVQASIAGAYVDVADAIRLVKGAA